MAQLNNGFLILLDGVPIYWRFQKMFEVVKKYDDYSEFPQLNRYPKNGLFRNCLPTLYIKKLTVATRIIQFSQETLECYDLEILLPVKEVSIISHVPEAKSISILKVSLSCKKKNPGILRQATTYYILLRRQDL